MTTKATLFNRVLSVLLVLCMFVSLINVVQKDTVALDAEKYFKISDPDTMDRWKDIFGADVLNTENAGGVWTDKSVFTDASKFANYGISLDDPNSFLVALSVIASNKSLSGLSTVPTDTMLILDISSSMYPGRDPSTVETMVTAVNSTVTKLQKMNKYNRVGVSIYFGGETLWESSASSSMVLLPLGRYTHGQNQYLRVDLNGTLFSGISVNSNVLNEKGNAISAGYQVKDVAGTYAQLGILDAMDQFLRPDIDTIVPANADYLSDITRVPVIVLMSDGEPTAATNNYTQREDFKMGNNQVISRNAAETDLVTQLTAAYAKKMIDDRYVESEPLFYTLSLGNSISLDVMDPALADKKSEDPNYDPVRANSNRVIRNYWNHIIQYGAAGITVQNFVDGSYSEKETVQYAVSKTTVNGEVFPSSLEQRLYVDEAFTAENADSLADAFDSVVEKIALQSRYYPTLVEGDEEESGYVSFVDVIGDYMEVDNIKGILVGNRLFSGAELSSNFVEGGGLLGTFDAPTDLGTEFVNAVQKRFGIPDVGTAEALIRLAYNHGQLSYTSPTEYSNYIGWYANANDEFLGFWHEGIETMPDPNDPTLSEDERPEYIMRCYCYLGEMDEEQGINESDMMYTIVQVREVIETGDEAIIFSVPAALIPMVNYDISLDEYGDVSDFSVSGATSPMSLIYEVGLDEGIDSITITDTDVVDSEYVKTHTDEDGSVYFYSNKFMADNSMGFGKLNTFSYFRPSHQNERYYFTEDTTIYVADGVPYSKATAPDVNGQYYRSATVYSNETALAAETRYYRLSSNALSVAKRGADGNWYIPKGTVMVNLDGYTVYKNPDNTNSIKDSTGRGVVDVPFVDIEGHNISNTNHNFVIGATLGNNGLLKIKPSTGIKISKTVSGEYEGNPSFEFTVTADNVNGRFETRHFAKDGTITEGYVSFESGKAKLYLKDGESVIITGLEAGKTYTVEETETVDFVLMSVNGSTGRKKADIVAEAGTINEANFVNSKRGKGNLTVTKTVTHKFGDAYQIPEDKLFDITVTLSGVGTANATFDVIHSGDSTLKTLTTNANGVFPTITLGNEEQIQILGLPLETAAIVREETPPAGFTATYKENGIRGDGVVLITTEPASVEVINAYNHGDVDGNDISIGGTKYLLDETGKAVENWGDAEFTIVFEEYANGDWVEIGRAIVNNGNRTFKFDLASKTYSEPGTYSYQVYEERPADEDKIEGMFYDPVKHTFSVVISDDDMDGGLEISRVYSNHSDKDFEIGASGKWEIAIDFTNVQSVTAPATVRVPVQKELINLSESSLVNLSGYEFGLYTDKACTTSATVGNGLAGFELARTDATGEGVMNLVFDKEGSYTYFMAEKQGNITGMTYDSKVVVINVEVVSSGVGGKLQADVTYSENTINDKLVFTNVYDVTEVSVDLDVRKTLEGRPLTANDVFTFEIRENDKAVLTGKNDANGKVTFNGSLVFTKVGTYKYTVVETSQSGNGITTDSSVYNVTITVTDGGRGKLTAKVSVLETAGETITFVNKYKTTSVDYTLSGTKKLTGRTLLNDEFTFVMAECDADGNVLTGGKTLSANNFSNGNFTFGKITYTKAGTYYYLVSEKSGTTSNGIQYDTAKFIVSVTVSDDGLGAFTAKAEIAKFGGEKADAIVFNNKYVPSPTEAVIPGVKILNGKVLGEGQFDFQLYEANGNWVAENLVETVKNSKDGKITFSEIQFDKAGTYYYLVKEAYDTLVADGITYDDTVYRVKVVVTDDLKGSLSAEVQIFDENNNRKTAIEFVNKYEVSQGDEVVINGVKYLEGRDLADGEFTFLLKDASGDIIQRTENKNGAFFFEIQYTGADAGKTFEYTVSELVEDLGGVTYDESVYNVKVVVKDNGIGGIETEVTITRNGEDVAGIAFTNNYKPAPTEIIIDGDKVLEGKDLTGGQFSFVLYTADEAFANLSQLQTVANGEDGSFAFDRITYDTAGTYYYVVKEVNGGNTENGIAYDGTVYNIKVTVTDNGNGDLVAEKEITAGNETKNAVVFVNRYTVSEGDSLVIEGTKVLDGRELVDGEFTFNLKDESGKVIQSAKNEGGKFSFRLDYKPEDAGETFVYTITEDEGTKGGVTYDSSVYTLTVVVNDNGVGGITLRSTIKKAGMGDVGVVFNNKYSPADTSVVISGTKTLEGKALADGQFSFTLHNANAEWIVGEAIETVSNKDGKFSFSKLTFDKAGTYYYIVTEVNGGNVENGITYDDTVYYITVIVEDDLNGALRAETAITNLYENKASVDFVNKYGVTGEESLVINGDKTLVGRDLVNGEFTFELKDESGKVIKTAVNNNGKFAFKLDYTAADAGKTFNYTISEAKGNLGGVTYDEGIYNVTVKVIDNGKGGIYLESEITKAGEVKEIASFVNTYEPTDASIVFEGTKTLEGKDLADGQFSFTLFASNENWTEGEAIQTVSNKDGKFAFNRLTYSETGVYYYIVKEVNGGNTENGITYDSAVYRAKITVTDDLAGALVIEAAIDNMAEAKTSFDFVNKYSVTGEESLVINGTKTFEGREMLDGEFTFELKDENGKVLQSASNAGGKFSFKLTYTAEDAGKTFNYTISEAEGTLGGVTYDSSIYNVTVNVTDNGNGGINLESTIVKEGESNADVVFSNSYSPESTRITLRGTKVLTGMNLADGQFSFTLYGADAEWNIGEAIQTVSNADGKFAFDTIEYTEAGTYYYIVKEVNGGNTENGITYDDTVYYITVIVEDNLKGSLTAETAITNTYENKASIDFVNNYNVSGEDSVVISGDKTLTGRDLEDGEFTFELKDESGNVIKTATNKDGKFNFVINYTGEDAGKVYNYTVSEVKGALGGITYDNSVYNVKVTVVDNGVGGIVATEEITKEGTAVTTTSFANTYNASDVEVILGGNKNLTGRDLVEGEFTFLLYEADGNFNIAEGVTPAIATNNADGSFAFEKLTFSTAGRYYFVVAENNSGADRVTYDSTVYNVIIDITDNGEGSLVASRPVVTKKDGTATDGTLVFNNVYTPKPADITASITVNKTVVSTGEETISPEDFEFVLENIASGEKTILRTDAYGKAIFTLSFTEEDIGKVYEYTLSETNEGLANITYSTAVYNIKVSVTLDSNNQLKAEFLQNDVATAEVVCSFENTFTPPPKPGDTSLSSFWIMMLVLSTLGFTSSIVVSKKRRNA